MNDNAVLSKIKHRFAANMLLIDIIDAPIFARRVVARGNRILGAEGFIYNAVDDSIIPLMDCVIDFSSDPVGQENVDELVAILQNNDFKKSNVIEFVLE